MAHEDILFQLKITLNFVQDIGILARKGMYLFLFKLSSPHVEIFVILQLDFFARFKVVHLDVDI
jgi:hypothetical protein